VRQSQSGEVTFVKITRPMLLAVQQAHSTYKTDLELNERSLKRKELADREKRLQLEIDAAEKLMSDGNTQLADANSRNTQEGYKRNVSGPGAVSRC